MTFFRSALFLVWFAVISVTLHIVCLPALLLPRKVTVVASRRWSALTFWGLKVFARLDYEVRGALPPDGVLIAAKHMSMWDTLALYLIVYDPAVVVKRELLDIPLYGWFLRKAGVIAVDRSGHASALRKMAAAARHVIDEDRSILIFPEGTRKNPDAAPDYKPGIAALYGQLGVACVPVALNSGLFWTGPMGVVKRRGKIVVEFLPAIPAGLKRHDFMAALEAAIEQATAKLIAEGRAILAKG